jgi:hypothetical protein
MERENSIAPWNENRSEDYIVEVLTEQVSDAYLAYLKNIGISYIQPGWVPTLMGFANGNTTTPDNLREGYMTQVWLAEATEPGSQVTGEYFFHQEIDRNFIPIVRDVAAQNRMLDAFAKKTGVSFPRD